MTHVTAETTPLVEEERIEKAINAALDELAECGCESSVFEGLQEAKSLIRKRTRAASIKIMALKTEAKAARNNALDHAAMLVFDNLIGGPKRDELVAAILALAEGR